MLNNKDPSNDHCETPNNYLPNVVNSFKISIEALKESK